MSEHDADSPEDLVVSVRDNPEKSRYEALVDAPGGANGPRSVAGFATYEVQGSRITFLHTEVDDAYEGHGIGSRLVRQSLDDVRERGLTVRPVCPFYKRYIREHPEYADLVAT
jgi:predicted GNAT family acetyltransferase